MSEKNAIGLDGLEFIEFSSHEPQSLQALFKEFGFSKTHRHQTKNVELFRQGDITLLLNCEPQSFSSEFCKAHGPCVSSMGWRVKDKKQALSLALKRGAQTASHSDYTLSTEGKKVPAISGVGESLIYLIETKKDLYQDLGFIPCESPDLVESKGFTVIDHLTNNVYHGTMKKWSNFYKNIFEFTEIRYFDIRGIKTGLTSYALKSPCEKFCIPINEASEKKSQINEYLDEYKGPGIQHIAFLSDDLVASLSKLQNTSIETLDIDDQYYEEVFQRVPNVTEDHKTLQDYQILVDGDEKGYLLQIFTKNIIGPIFIEMIQRKNHYAFGEGNFSALFRSIERDQQKRGYLES